jgi:hypothetical protein
LRDGDATIFRVRLSKFLLSFVIVAFAGFASASGERYFVLRSRISKTFAESEALPKPTLGTVYKGKGSLQFSQKVIRLVVKAETGKMTGKMTGKKNAFFFSIQGLVNPSLVIPAGATVQILFVNESQGMFHDLIFSDDLPPFKNRPALKHPMGSSFVPPITAHIRHADELVFIAPKVRGMNSYLCTVMQHAANGMYGVIETR